MPNHVTNKMKIVGKKKEVEEVLDFIKDDKLGIGTIDFNKITPMPRWVYGSDKNIKGISNHDIKKWGHENTALDWCVKNWGTLYNAYGQLDERSTLNTVYFQTAYVCVPDLIQKIAFIFPNVTISYEYADSDYGSNCGIYQFCQNVTLFEIEHEENSKEAYNLGFELVNNNRVPDHFRFNKEINNYEYIEE